MRVACLFSGGKDSCLALHLARKKHDVAYLVNMDVENADSWMFHKPYPELIEKQAEELGIELVKVKSKGKQDEEVNDLKQLLAGLDIDGVVIGGIASNYQGKRIKRVCDELGLEMIAPLWNFSPEELWDCLLENNFKVILTKIACQGLGKEWLGKVIDKQKLDKMKELAEKYRFRLDFEGGEAETAVLDMPGFKHEIDIDFSIYQEGAYRAWLELEVNDIEGRIQQEKMKELWDNKEDDEYDGLS
ncbi:MAG: diphthine--ammonia ligase [Candidatus Nanoarchaeia archaeon]